MYKITFENGQYLQHTPLRQQRLNGVHVEWRDVYSSAHFLEYKLLNV